MTFLLIKVLLSYNIECLILLLFCKYFIFRYIDKRWIISRKKFMNNLVKSLLTSFIPCILEILSASWMFCHFSLFLQIYLEPSVLTLNFVLHYIIKYKLYFLCPIGLIFIAQCSLILRGSYLFELILLDCNLSLFKLINDALIWR